MSSITDTANRRRVSPHFLSIPLTPKQTKRMFDIADIPFTGVSDEEKQPYVADIKQTGSYQGYKLRRYWVKRLSLIYCRGNPPRYSILTMESSIRSSITTVSTIHSSIVSSSPVQQFFQSTVISQNGNIQRLFARSSLRSRSSASLTTSTSCIRSCSRPGAL